MPPSPPAVRRPEPAAGVNRFAFVIHPLHVGFIHAAPGFRWTRHLPDAIVEEVAAWGPPRLLSRITGLARESLKAFAFGAGADMDAFEAAFRLPNILRRHGAEDEVEDNFNRA